MCDPSPIETDAVCADADWNLWRLGFSGGDLDRRIEWPVRRREGGARECGRGEMLSSRRFAQ